MAIPVHHRTKVPVLGEGEEAPHRLVHARVAAVQLRVREHVVRLAAKLGQGLGDRRLHDDYVLLVQRRPLELLRRDGTGWPKR